MNNYYEIYNKINLYLRKKAWYSLDYTNIDDIINRTIYTYYDKYNKIDLDEKNIGSILKFSFNKMMNVYNEKSRYYRNKCEYKNFYDNILCDKRVNVLDFIILKERNKILLDCIDKLSFIYRKIIILHFYYDYTFKEISIILNINYKQILKYKNNASSLLKNMLYDVYYFN